MRYDKLMVSKVTTATSLAFVTSHSKKAAELSRYLNYPVSHHKIDLPEIQSLDTYEIVTSKSLAAFQILRRPVMVEDFSIRFAALGKLPGPLIKWFLQEVGPMGLCQMLDGYDTRAAVAQTCFALCDNNKEVKIFEGSMEGNIAKTPRGNDSYGTDSIFIPKGSNKTWGEMTYDEQTKTSLRKIGLSKLEDYLNK